VRMSAVFQEVGRSQPRLPDEQIERARDVRVEEVLAAHGIRLRRVNGIEFEGPCPNCGGDDRFSINTRKQVFNCRGCGARGGAIDLEMFLSGSSLPETVKRLTGGRAPSSRLTARPARVRREPEVEEDDPERFRRLWRRGIIDVENTIGGAYLRVARGYQGPIPSTIRFLLGDDRYPPSLIFALGMPEEPEPGVLEIADHAIRAVHLIKLRLDGSDRIRDDKGKITIGRGAMGSPIVLSPMNDLLGLVIVEGPEKGLGVFAGTGLGVWAAGGATRMPDLADTVPEFTDHITVIRDEDENGVGLKFAGELAARLVERFGEERVTLTPWDERS
jgi:hypothetical protein